MRVNRIGGDVADVPTGSSSVVTRCAVCRARTTQRVTQVIPVRDLFVYQVSTCISQQLMLEIQPYTYTAFVIPWPSLTFPTLCIFACLSDLNLLKQSTNESITSHNHSSQMKSKVGPIHCAAIVQSSNHQQTTQVTNQTINQ